MIFRARARTMVRLPFLAGAVGALLVVAAITAIVVMHPYLSLDASIERDLQRIDLGPVTKAFPFLSWLGGPGGIYMEASVLFLVLVLNRRDWLLAIAVLAGGIWYEVMVHLVNRPRPTVIEVLRVTEHPGASSFPSGHLIFVTLCAAALMLCLGDRYLSHRARVIGWTVVAGIVITEGVDRIYVGAHWPTDVLGGVLIATAWVSLLMSVRGIFERDIARRQLAG
jgi:membrane-associated phospholipid phosphatase